MMIMEELDMEAFDETQVRIGYLKLFPHMVKDFLTRADAKQIMDSNNLHGSISGTAQITAALGRAPVTGSATISPAYTGEQPSAGTEALKKVREVEERAGGVAIENRLEENL